METMHNDFRGEAIYQAEVDVSDIPDPGGTSYLGDHSKLKGWFGGQQICFE